MKHLSLVYLLICAACEFGVTTRAYGHGFAGARFFPATLSTDDPFVSDELSLPTVTTIRTPENGGTRETDISVDISKRITPEFAIEIGDTFTALNPHEGRAASGFRNLELSGKYQLLKNGEHETLGVARRRTDVHAAAHRCSHSEHRRIDSPCGNLHV